jgi:hypothetical protein
MKVNHMLCFIPSSSTHKVGRKPLSIKRAAGLLYGRALGLTLDDIGKIAGVSHTTVFNYTLGVKGERRRNMTITIARKTGKRAA